MIKISCCIITLDQAERLSMAIKNIKGYVDEIVVIDGGSTDNTVELATSLGAKVFFRKWDDDFGSQRNYSIKKAENDWILVLDSDESLKFGSEYNLKKIIEENPDSDGFKFTRANYLDKKQSGSMFDFDIQLRLFRKYGYYKDKIHEVVTGLKDSYTVDKSKCLMLHYKSKEEQKQHLLYQKKLIISVIKELERKSKLSQEETSQISEEKRLLTVWDTWWKDAN